MDAWWCNLQDKTSVYMAKRLMFTNHRFTIGGLGDALAVVVNRQRREYIHTHTYTEWHSLATSWSALSLFVLCKRRTTPRSLCNGADEPSVTVLCYTRIIYTLAQYSSRFMSCMLYNKLGLITYNMSGHAFYICGHVASRTMVVGHVGRFPDNTLLENECYNSHQHITRKQYHQL